MTPHVHLTHYTHFQANSTDSKLLHISTSTCGPLGYKMLVWIHPHIIIVGPSPDNARSYQDGAQVRFELYCCTIKLLKDQPQPSLHGLCRIIFPNYIRQFLRGNNHIKLRYQSGICVAYIIQLDTRQSTATVRKGQPFMALCLMCTRTHHSVTQERPTGC